DQWLVVYLGFGSAKRPTWRVHSVEIGKGSVRFSYSKAAEEKGDRPYLFWVPVGPLEWAKTRVELYDQGTKRVTLFTNGKDDPLEPMPDRIIPLRSVYTTTGRPGLRHLPTLVIKDLGKTSVEQPYAKDLGALRRNKADSLNLFLVEGAEIT